MIKKLFFTLLCTAVCRTISAQVVDPYVPAPENLRARTEFQDAKFGIFLHWGLYSLLGTGEWTMTNRNINYQEYAKLANAFYPHDFDAAEWVSAIKSSGAGYVCFTTRHHDGFSMWDTAQTDYDIVDATPEAPTLTFNEIGRHQSRLVRTRICSDLSPWLSQCDADELYTVAISHGEGRFVANDEVLDQLRAGGQIATQYVDVAGMPSMDLDVNPNGSVACIEGITSPDGRVFGKMGHVERRGDGLYKNVPGEKFMPLIESGVAYFG